MTLRLRPTAALGRLRAVRIPRLLSPLFDIRLDLRVGSDGSDEAVGDFSAQETTRRDLCRELLGRVGNDQRPVSAMRLCTTGSSRIFF